MNRNERDDLAIYLGLQDFEVTLVEVEAARRQGRIEVLGLARRLSARRCHPRPVRAFSHAQHQRHRDDRVGDERREVGEL